MKASLKTKISIFITLVIIIISTISTYLFISAHSRAITREMIARGIALSYSLAKAAERGLINEDLDLLTDASYIVFAEDVNQIEIYSTTWDTIQAYPFGKHREMPHPDAIKHFKKSDAPIYIKKKDMYDFYSPILFQPAPDVQKTIIGFTKICVSAAQLQKELNKTTASNIIISGFITLIAVLSVNLLTRRIVLNPIARLHKSIAMFKNGILPDNDAPDSDDEIGELTREFNHMAQTIKEKTDMLIDSEKKIRLLFERTEHALFKLDKDGRIIESNPKFNETFGNITKLCDIYISEKDNKTCLERAVSGNVVHVEENVVDRKGNKLTVMLSLYPDIAPDGSIKCIDGYMIDITEKKRLEERLAQSQRMEAIGTLAGGIAHDFNNILQGILGYTSLLKMKISETDPIYKPLDVIEQSANKAASLTRQLLGFARGGKYITKPINLNTAVEDVLQIISRTFDASIEIKTSLANDLWAVEADQSQIEHMLMNICINARDAMPAGGILTIETVNHVFTERELSNLQAVDADTRKYVVIKVTDTGIGIPKDIQHRIFEPFFTTKEKGKGTGMGLAMVYGVVKNHNGFITVDSEIGKGTTFTIYLPATEKEVRADEIKLEKISYGKGTVLLVDDEDIVRNVGKAILENCGYKVIEAADGKEAVEVYKTKKDEIDVVILDIIMPKMGGKEAFERMKEINPDIKVLVSSGYSINSTAQEIINLGAKGFLQKPYNFSDLANKIKNVIS